ncbi:MAG: hypothetical protein KDC53_03405 [Saprospiraceae bacterium]|nr:hypothetical protein [Saprospiraceae bacterium]
MRRKCQLSTCIVLILITSLNLHAQDPTRFADQIEQMKAMPPQSKENLIIFTGSSSVRMWKDVASTFPEYNIVNRGFGGSQMSDLLYYVEDIVIKDMPCEVFIYEGDNDISAGKSTDAILQDTREVVEKIWAANPHTDIVLISPKPSVARWNMRDKYLALNQELRKMAKDNSHLRFVDVWTPALDADGVVFQDIFLEDNLHMNAKGYAIWEKAVRPYLRKCD